MRSVLWLLPPTHRKAVRKYVWLYHVNQCVLQRRQGDPLSDNKPMHYSPASKASKKGINLIGSIGSIV